MGYQDEMAKVIDEWIKQESIREIIKSIKEKDDSLKTFSEKLESGETLSTNEEQDVMNICTKRTGEIEKLKNLLDKDDSIVDASKQ